MFPFRIIRSGMLLAGLSALSGATVLASLDGFTTPLTPTDQASGPVAPDIDELDRVADESESSTRTQPRQRPRLKHGALLSETGRLRVHGGMSFTVGGGSGGSFHGASTWVSYHDPVTGISLGFSFSQMSGNGYFGDYAGYGYSPRYYSTPVSYYSALPRVQLTDPERAGAPSFIRDGRR